MSISSPDFYSVTSTDRSPTQVPADSVNKAKIQNLSGGTLYYKSSSDVTSSSNDGNLTAGQTVTVSTANWITTTSAVNVGVFPVAGVAYAGDETVAGTEVVTGTLGVTGITTLTGGIGPTATKAAALGTHAYTAALDTTATLANYGTDAAAADNKTVYLCSLLVPVNCTVTGIGTLNGTNITTDKIVNYLFNASGTKLGQSAAAGTAPTPADTFQETDLTAPITITGPAVYFIGRQHNGTTIGFQSIPTAKGYRPLAGSVAGTSFGAETAVVPPTSFTADKGPFGYLY